MPRVGAEALEPGPAEEQLPVKKKERSVLYSITNGPQELHMSGGIAKISRPVKSGQTPIGKWNCTASSALIPETRYAKTPYQNIVRENYCE
jgi:hypothetical protein